MAQTYSENEKKQSRSRPVIMFENSMDQMIKNEMRNVMRKNGRNDHDSMAEYLQCIRYRTMTRYRAHRPPHLIHAV